MLKCKEYNKKPTRRILPYESSRWYQSSFNHSVSDEDPAKLNLKLAENRVLLLNTVYDVSSDKSINVGLDIENDFQPTIQFLKLASTIPSLYLNTAEWKLLDSINSTIEENFKTELSRRTYEISSNLTLSFWLLYNKPCMKISDSNSKGAIFFTEPTWKLVMELKPIVTASLMHVTSYAVMIKDIYEQLYNELNSNFKVDSIVTKEVLENMLNIIDYKEKFVNLEIDNKPLDLEFESAFMSLFNKKLLKDLNLRKCNNAPDFTHTFYFDTCY